MNSIAIDFDRTITAAPDLFVLIHGWASKRGIQLYCVTARDGTEDDIETINAVLDHWGIQMPVLFSKRGSKLALVERLGIKIDIWIDDDIATAVRGF